MLGFLYEATFCEDLFTFFISYELYSHVWWYYDEQSVNVYYNVRGIIKLKSMADDISLNYKQSSILKSVSLL